MPITITELALQHFSLATVDFKAWLNILTDDIVMELPYRWKEKMRSAK